jgi:hypothetical protein
MINAILPCAECSKHRAYLNVYVCPAHGTWSRGLPRRKFNRSATWRRYEKAGAEVLAKVNGVARGPLKRIT